MLVETQPLRDNILNKLACGIVKFLDVQYDSKQHRALGDVDDSSLFVSPLPSNAKTAWLIKCAGLRPSCANCDMLHSEGSLHQSGRATP